MKYPQFFRGNAKGLNRNSDCIKGKRTGTPGPAPALAPIQREDVAEVLRRPDDDEPRLKAVRQFPKSDHLRQFVELQVKAANPSDPSAGVRAALDSFLLLSKHFEERRWLPPWEEATARIVQKLLFKRGFVELVRVNGSDFLNPQFADLLERAPIRHLDFESTAGLWKQLAGERRLGTIRSISLSDNHLEDADLEAMSRSTVLSSLKWLSLANNDINESGVEALATHKENFPNLEYVCFAGNFCDPVERFAADGDLITRTWLPDAGERLERKFGPIPWLHIKARKMDDILPDRFALPQKPSAGGIGAEIKARNGNKRSAAARTDILQVSR